jgi:hypothetical protein
MESAEQIAWVLGLLLGLALLAAMASRGLLRSYTWFAAFLCLDIVQTLAMLPLDKARDLYAWAYFCTQPLIWLLFVLAVLELYTLALGRHPGIASLSRWVMFGALFVSVLLSGFSLSADLSRPADQFPVLRLFTVVERGVTFSLLIFLLFITGFLLWTPVAVRRNIVTHACLFSVYFLASSFALFVRNFLGLQVVSSVSLALLIISDLCLMLWILLLTRKGERTEVVVRRRWHEADVERLQSQLDAVNNFLLKPGRR